MTNFPRRKTSFNFNPKFFWLVFIIFGIILIAPKIIAAGWTPFQGASPVVGNCLDNNDILQAQAGVPCYFKVSATDPDNDDVQYLLHLGITNIADFDEASALVATNGPDYPTNLSAANDCETDVPSGVDMVASGTQCAQKVTFSSIPSGQWCYGFGVKDATGALTTTLRCYATGEEDNPKLESVKLKDGSNYKNLAAGCSGDCTDGALKNNNGNYWQDDQNNTGCGTSKSAPLCRVYPVVKNLPTLEFTVSKPDTQQGWLKYVWVFFDQINPSCNVPWKCVYGYGAPAKDSLDDANNKVRVELGNNYNVQSKTFNPNNSNDPMERKDDTVSCQRQADAGGKKWWKCSYQINNTATFNHKWWNVRVKVEDSKQKINDDGAFGNWSTTAHLKFAIDPVSPANTGGATP